MVKTSKKGVKKKSKKKVRKPTKKNTQKKTSLEKKYNSVKQKKTEKILVDNFVALQKVMVNLSSKFDNLSTQISKLLELFEISAKSLAQKDFEKDRDKKESKEILKKLDNISQQAGLIGKGLVLIHENSSGKGFSTHGMGSENKFENMEKSKMVRRPINMPGPSKFPLPKTNKNLSQQDGKISSRPKESPKSQGEPKQGSEGVTQEIGQNPEQQNNSQNQEQMSQKSPGTQEI
ncbi:MAG: hypothetical protein WDZ62_00065 [Candidatus Pacearchaeota archaeon]